MYIVFLCLLHQEAEEAFIAKLAALARIPLPGKELNTEDDFIGKDFQGLYLKWHTSSIISNSTSDQGFEMTPFSQYNAFVLTHTWYTAHYICY